MSSFRILLKATRCSALAAVVLFGLCAPSLAQSARLALLPLDAPGKLAIYGQPVAAEVARVLGDASLLVVVVGAEQAVPLEVAPLVHNAITGEALPVVGGIAGAATRVGASALRTGVGVWTSGLAVVLWPLAVLTHALLRRVAASAGRP